MVNTIIFDIDDTLYDNQKVFNQAFEQAFKEKNFAYDPLELFLCFRKNSDLLFNDFSKGKLPKDKYRYQRLNQTLKSMGYQDISKSESDIFQNAYSDNLDRIEIEASMLKTIIFLKNNNFNIGVITNGPHDRQWRKIRTLGLENWIDKKNIFVSGDYQVSKPSIEIFKICEQHMKLSNPNQILYVGDSFENDVIGAKSAGWQVLWANHRGMKSPQGAIYKPDFVSYHFDNIYSDILNICGFSRF